MVDPLFALLIGASLVVAAVLLLWPRFGLIGRIKSALHVSERVLIEDALKHLYDCECQKVPCTRHSIAGSLQIKSKRTEQVISRLLDLELVRLSEGTYRLTQEGRSYALKIIRIHRLWESYLSETTGIHPNEWHAIADRKEHSTSALQATELAAQMNFPRFDPHGDPIPTSEGDMIPPPGTALTEILEPQLLQVVHIEDEPASVYQQLLAFGLYLGATFRLIEATPHHTRIEFDGNEHILAPTVATNLSVAPISETDEKELGAPLSSLQMGQAANVIKLSAACRGFARRRLLDLGFLPGTKVIAEMRSPAGDPMAYRVRGALIALRKEQADLIQITPHTIQSIAT